MRIILNDIIEAVVKRTGLDEDYILDNYWDAIRAANSYYPEFHQDTECVEYILCEMGYC